MSKKVKDLTLEEIKELCTEHYPVCKKNGKKCPMFKTTINCDQIMSIIRSALRHNHDALEEEIEIVSCVQQHDKICNFCIYYGYYDGVPICKHGSDIVEAANLIKLPYCPFKDKNNKQVLEGCIDQTTDILKKLANKCLEQIENLKKNIDEGDNNE